MRFVLGMLVVGAAVAATYFSIQSLGSTPPAAERGWVAPRRSDAGEVRRLEAAARRIEAQSPAILSLLVVHHGRLLLEKYFHGVDRSSDLDVYSITKSFTSTLTGIAIDRGEIRSVDQPIADFLPRRELAGADPRVRGITLRDLLTMRGGFPGDGDPRNGIGEVDDVTSALLHRPLVREPGTAFAYDTGSYYILSAVITHATGMPASEYARRHLLVPMGMKDVTWWRGLHGVSSGGTGIGSTARDMARFGELVLNRGRWNGRQIVPKGWLERATRARSSLGHGRGYGFGWWTATRNGLDVYAAVGFGGQVVAIVPRLDLVFAMATDTAGVPADWEKVVFGQIVPAAHNKS